MKQAKGPSPYRPVLLLTGANGRLGQAFIERYKLRYRIVATSRRPFAGVVEGFDFIDGDLTESHAVPVDFALDRHGRIDALVNNAASLDRTALMKNQRPLPVRRQFDINTAVPYELVHYIFQQFWGRQPPDANHQANRSIVNIGSISAFHYAQLAGGYCGHFNYGVYAASKAALACLTRHLSYELKAAGIRINMLAPDAFPEVIPTAAVCAEISALLTDARHGEIVELGAHGLRTHEFSAQNESVMWPTQHSNENI
jgi:NAD(P)-dependent dehydrogenase (short-subunit alcohol dehydrogenase family)